MNFINEIREELLSAAQSRKTVTYGRLMKRFRLSRGRKLSEVIGRVDRTEYKLGAPGFAPIIVRKDTGYPGGGYFCGKGLPNTLQRTPTRSTDPRLTADEKLFVKSQQERTWAYYKRTKH